MSLLGVYPFKVKISNTFNPDPANPENTVTIKVVHYQRLTYYDETTQGIIISRNPSPSEYSISGGNTLCFPIFFGNEYVEVSLDGTPAGEYNIWAGARAKCYPVNNGETVQPELDSSLGNGTDKYGKYFRGGIWKSENLGTNWTMTIRKYGPDPEDDDVVVGPDTPG